MFFKTPRKVGEELASSFRQVAVPLFHGTEAMKKAELTGEFRFPDKFFDDDYCLGFLFGSFDAYITRTAAEKWNNDKRLDALFHGAHYINGEPETLARYAERRQNVLPNEDHALNTGYEHGLTVSATVLQIIRPEEYDTNPLLIEASTKVEQQGLRFTSNKHDEVCFYLISDTLKAYIDQNWK